MTRHREPSRRNEAGEVTAYYASLNRGKSSVVLDLKNAEGSAVMTSLLEGADVFVTNMRASALERLGLHPKALHERYPRLVIVSISGFGMDDAGEYGDRAGLAIVAEAMSGATGLTRDHSGNPVWCGFALGDITAAVSRCGADGVPEFVEVGFPTDDDVHALLQTIIARLMKMLTRRGVLVEDMGQTYLAEPDADGEDARTLRPLQAAAITYRIALGPRAGQKVLTLRGAMPREATARQPLCADIDGFSLHAAVRVEAHDRKRLEQLCRYITRPALSDQRVQLNDAGQVELKLKTPWRDGTTHLVMSPLEFMQRLAALVPRPRLHLIRFHGVLAPNAKLRPLVVPQGPPAQAQAATEAAAAAEREVETVQAGLHRIGWARLLKRVFDIDMQHCPNCRAGELKIIAAILERPVIEKILTHLGLDPQPPPRGRAREARQD